MRGVLIHGHNTNAGQTPTYRSWVKMLQRCTNPKSHKWQQYGGRGIRVCVRWLEFQNFLSDMGLRPEGMTLDREDVNGDYGPDNCRWATRSQQQNNRRDTVFLEFNGERHSITEWAAITGIAKVTINFRLRRGWTVARALTFPVDAAHTFPRRRP